jgi:hypothetical protein
MPLDNPEQNDPQPEPTIDWQTAPDQIRTAHERTKDNLDKERTKAAALARENTALRAGIDVESPLGKMFVGSYDGEMTTEAMKSAFEALGVTPRSTPANDPPVPPVQDGPTDDELAEMRNRRLLQSGSTPPGGEPVGELWTGTVFPTFQEGLAQGQRREVAFSHAVDKLFEAAMDPQHPQHDQAVWNRDRWMANFQ